MRSRAVVGVVLLVVALSAAGCGAPSTDAGAPSTPPAPSASAPSPTTTPPTTTPPTTTPSTTTPSSTTAAGPPTTAMGRRCGAPDVEASVETVAGPAGERLTLSTVGSGPTVALLLHQTDRVASCGWWRFANRLAEQGVRAALLDFCGYATSTCDTPWAGDYTDQVVRTMARLRDTGATRVTLVGASIGGTVAVVSATPARADAVVDLSGFGFSPMVTGPSIAALTVPVLGAGSHSEQTESATLQTEVLGSASPTKRFLWDQGGHGYTLVFDGPTRDAPVSPIGRAVIGWVNGSYAD